MVKKKRVNYYESFEDIETDYSNRANYICQLQEEENLNEDMALSLLNSMHKQYKIDVKAFSKKYIGYDKRFIVGYPEEEDKPPAEQPAAPQSTPLASKELAIVPPPSAPGPVEGMSTEPEKPKTMVFEAEVIPPASAGASHPETQISSTPDKNAATSSASTPPGEKMDNLVPVLAEKLRREAEKKQAG